MKPQLLLICALLVSRLVVGQQNIDLIKENTYVVNSFNEDKIQDFLEKKIENSQFIMLGEQHGIKEISEIANTIYNSAYQFGYNTLCIETSPFAAKTLDTLIKTQSNIEYSLKKLYEKYPVSIPFYNNKSDIQLFTNIASKKGELWGIDQVFMVEFRLVFDYLVNKNKNKKLKEAVIPLLKESIIGYNIAVKNKDFTAPFIFKYTDELHERLLSLTTTSYERKLLENLMETKKIYSYNFQKQYYMNNNERARLMKQNFITYYTNTEKKPKVIFKLGANHVAKGLSATNVFDISNLVSELAIINGKKSIHIYAIGVNGMQNLGHPFAPVSVVPFENSKNLPKEISGTINNQEGKFMVIDTEKLKSVANQLSDEMKRLVLAYDILIYIKDCKALEDLTD